MKSNTKSNLFIITSGTRKAKRTPSSSNISVTSDLSSTDTAGSSKAKKKASATLTTWPRRLLELGSNLLSIT